MAIRLTLSQIIELSGGNPRRMKQWANEGVFLPIEEERPSRAARNYSISEAALACIITRLDQFNISTATLKEIAASLRSIYEVPKDYGFMNATEGDLFWRQEILSKPSKNEKSTPEGRKKNKLPTGNPSGLSSDELHRIHNWVLLEKAREGQEFQLSLSVSESGSWTYWLDNALKSEDGVEIFIVLNLHQILSVLR